MYMCKHMFILKYVNLYKYVHICIYIYSNRKNEKYSFRLFKGWDHILFSHFNSVKHISLGNASYYGNIIIVT